MSRSSLAVVTESLLEIDHCFVCLPAPLEASALADLGLNCASQTLRRAEQGTASQSIFFENIYLELIWVENAAATSRYALQSGIDFQARSARQASPFGIALRQNPQQTLTARPFNRLSSPMDAAQIFLNFAADNLSSKVEPLCFVIPDALSLLALLDHSSLLHRQMLCHPAGMRHLTSARITVESVGRFSDSVNLLQCDGIIEVVQGAMPLLELSFDHQQQQRALDLRWLGIPMVLRY